MIDTLLVDAMGEEWRIYTPVLRAKTSEWKALSALTPGVRGRIAPIIEFVPEWRGPSSTTSNRKRRAPQTPAEYVDRMVQAAATATPTGTRSFVYFGHGGANAQWSGIDLWSVFDTCIPVASRVIPLVDLNHMRIASLARAVEHRGEVGLRLGLGDLEPRLDARIQAARRAFGIPSSLLHIIVDLKDGPSTVSHERIRRTIGTTAEFASVVVLAGVFPVDLTQYQPGIAAEPRTEWNTWWREHEGTPIGERLLEFGDYTTQCAHYRPSPSLPGSVSLRYTTDESILVFRGKQSNSGAGLGYEQIHGHCRLLVKRPDYDGAVFSAGDQRIHCWTDPTKGPGNPEQWRAAGLVHHITHVVAQLQDATGSSATVREWARRQVPAPCA